MHNLLNMNEVIKNIKARRSCRSYDPTRMPSDEVIAQICEAGTWAPTGKGFQKPIILAVTNKELRDRIMRMNAKIMGTSNDPFYGAPAMLIVLVEDWPNAQYDGACVMQTLMLAAESLGVNTCWINRAREEFESEEGKQILAELGIEGNYVGVGHVALGYANKPIPEPKPRKEDYVRWVK